MTAQQAFELAQRVQKFVEANDEVQLEIDPLSSDQLSVLLLREPARVAQLREIYPSGRGIGRATRLMSLAKQVQECVEAEKRGTVL